jgi:hypothetical protein
MGNELLVYQQLDGCIREQSQRTLEQSEGYCN